MKNSSLSRILLLLSILLLIGDPVFVHSLTLARYIIVLAVIFLFTSMFYTYKASSKKEITESGAWGNILIGILLLVFGGILLFVTFWSANPGPM
jgi:NADH:ubiquinone oxidoreductase subunit 6 (subunit J)